MFRCFLITYIAILFPSLVFAQSVCVQGNIMDAQTKVNLKSVQITIKGTTKGVISNYEGSFLICANKGDTLIFSQFGYNQYNYETTSDEKIDVYLYRSKISDTTIRVFDGNIFYPLTSDVAMQTDIQNGRIRYYIYPLLVLNNVIIRDSITISKFRNTIKYEDIKHKKHITKQEAESIGINNVPNDGVLFVEIKKNRFIDI